MQLDEIIWIKYVGEVRGPEGHGQNLGDHNIQSAEEGWRNHKGEENEWAQRWKENQAYVFMEAKEVSNFKKERKIKKYFQSSKDFQSVTD